MTHYNTYICTWKLDLIVKLNCIYGSNILFVLFVRHDIHAFRLISVKTDTNEYGTVLLVLCPASKGVMQESHLLFFIWKLEAKDRQRLKDRVYFAEPFYIK